MFKQDIIFSLSSKFSLRNRIRQYPSLINCTTIDWFSEWPKDALLEVAEKHLEDANIGKGEGVETVSIRRPHNVLYCINPVCFPTVSCVEVLPVCL